MTINKSLLSKLYPKGEEDTFVTLSGLLTRDSKVIQTISPSVNWILGGGIVPGRAYCFAGPPGAGKSMFAVSCAGELLQSDPDGVVIWFDAEKSFSNHWANLYIDGDQAYKDSHLIIREVDYTKQVFDYFLEYVVDVVKSGIKVHACIVDSVQNLIPPADEAKSSLDDRTVASMAQYLGDALRKVLSAARKCEITWIFISQIRDNMDMFTSRINKYKVPGGNHFHHMVDCLVMFEPGRNKDMRLYAEEKGLDGKETQVGQYIKAKVQDKNRLSAPNRTALFKFLYDKGIVDTHEEIIDLAINQGVLSLRGSNFYLGETKVGTGRDKLLQAVVEDSALLESIHAVVKTKF